MKKTKFLKIGLLLIGVVILLVAVSVLKPVLATYVPFVIQVGDEDIGYVWVPSVAEDLNSTTESWGESVDWEEVLSGSQAQAQVLSEVSALNSSVVSALSGAESLLNNYASGINYYPGFDENDLPGAGYYPSIGGSVSMNMECGGVPFGMGSDWAIEDRSRVEESPGGTQYIMEYNVVTGYGEGWSTTIYCDSLSCGF